MYFAQVGGIGERVCVARCPKGGDERLECKATRTRGCNFNTMEGYEVEYYETVHWMDRNGHFCMPTD